MLRRQAAHHFGRGRVSQAGYPDWRPASNYLKTVNLNALSDVNPCPGNACWYSENNGLNGPWVNWCGAIWAPHYGTHGAWVIRGGGHQGYSGIELKIYDVGLRRWIVRGVTPPTDFTGSLDATWGDYDYLGSLIVPADHTYSNMVYLPPSMGGGSQGSMVTMFNTYGTTVGYRPHKIDLATGVSSRLTTNTYNPSYPSGGYGGCFVDTVGGVIWGTAGIESNLNCKIDTNVSPLVITPDSSFYVPGYYYTPCFVPEARKNLCVRSNAGTLELTLYDLASGTPVPVSITTTTTLTGQAISNSLTWVPVLRKFFLYGGLGATSFVTLTPPYNYSDWTTGNWVWGTETPLGETFANILDIAPGAQGGQAFTRLQWMASAGCLGWCDGPVVKMCTDGIARDGAFQAYTPIGA